MAKIKVDFTGVESFIKCEEGLQKIKLTKMEEGSTQNGDAKLTANFLVVGGSSDGARILETFTFEKALFKFKAFLEAVKVKADGKTVIDTDKLIGKMCMAEVGMKEFKDKQYPEILTYIKIVADAVADVEEDFEDDIEDVIAEKPVVKVKKEKPEVKKKPEPVIEDDDDFEDDEDDDWED